MNTCQAQGCGRAIPARQQFCRRCLERLPPDVRHAILFGTGLARDEALKIAEKELSGGGPASIKPPNPARERFRAAREHAAAAMRTLERKKL